MSSNTIVSSNEPGLTFITGQPIFPTLTEVVKVIYYVFKSEGLCRDIVNYCLSNHGELLPLHAKFIKSIFVPDDYDGDPPTIPSDETYPLPWPTTNSIRLPVQSIQQEIFYKLRLQSNSFETTASGELRIVELLTAKCDSSPAVLSLFIPSSIAMVADNNVQEDPVLATLFPSAPPINNRKLNLENLVRESTSLSGSDWKKPGLLDHVVRNGNYQAWKQLKLAYTLFPYTICPLPTVDQDLTVPDMVVGITCKQQYKIPLDEVAHCKLGNVIKEHNNFSYIVDEVTATQVTLDETDRLLATFDVKIYSFVSCLLFHLIL